MCLATAYFESDGQLEEAMQDVAWIKPESSGLQLTTLLGESRRFRAKIKGIDLVNNVIILEEPISESRETIGADQEG
jgi:predicted RNA-binding protein